jgi:hypothetical protein
MQDWQQRVIDEKNALDDRAGKLYQFAYNADPRSAFYRLPAVERERLLAQYSIMQEYSNILGARITAWG